jgi:hypothetical protein
VVPICGIAGFSISPNERINARKLAKLLAIGVEHRGPDATGFAWVTPQGTVQIQKGPKPAHEFVRELALWKQAKTCIIHTRMPTVGDPKNNVNNHPITAGHIVGVHNGWLRNDDWLFKSMGIEHRRQGLVDSEAIFAAIAWGLEADPTDGKPRIGKAAKDLTDVLYEVDGAAAIAWLNTSDDVNRLHVSRVSTNPLVCVETAGGSFIFASEEGAIEDACKRMNIDIVKSWDLREGEWLTYNKGDREDWVTYTPPMSWYGSYSKTDYSGGGKTTKVTGGSSAGTTTKYTFSNGQWVERDSTVVDRASSDVTEMYRFEQGWIPVGRAFDGQLKYRPERDDFVYKDRVDDILAHRSWMETDLMDQWGYTQLMVETELHEMGANLRPGSQVYAKLGSQVHLADVVTMPQTFPDGKYLLRAVVENGRVILFEATYAEFEVADLPLSEMVDNEPESSTGMELVLFEDTPFATVGELVDAHMGLEGGT